MGLLDPPPLSKTVADATYAAALSADTGALAMGKIRLGLDTKIGIAGDSTGNAADEWFDLLATSLGTQNPNMRVEIPHWDDTTQAYLTPTVIQPGVAGASGVVFHDTFNRVAADLYGSTPDIGAVWGRDGANATGDWSVDGTDAVRTSDTTVGTVLATAAPGDMTTWVSANISTAQTGTARLFRVYSQMKDTSNSVYLTLTVNATGVPSFTISKRIAAAITVIATGATIPSLPTDSASNEVTFELTLSGSTITAKVNNQSISATLTAPDLAALSGATMAGIAGSSAGGAGDRIHEFKVTVGSAAPPALATFYNASMSGSTLTYQQTRLAAMYPQPLDLLFISSCHNYSMDTPAQYATKLDAFITAFKAVQPNAGIIICSQNPEKPPAVNRAAHLVRLSSIPAYARRRRYGYVPVAELFVTQPNGGVGLIISDGVHPTTGATDSGSSLWRDSAFNYLNPTTKSDKVLDATYAPAPKYGTAAPSGTTPALVGDEIRNSAPAELGTAGSKYVIRGWICVTAGTPGTWLPMRLLTGN